ncbi:MULTISPECIES: DUF2842 domain-containing protein [Microvirga]|uniref:DUF2842 domain-containing protein n=1 Tax=Microvirga TaxID=186650 RepID=UPI001CFF9FA3|nr:DUF2842 domain-containing protein [Microvirga lenta]MCB5177486.1 DUF2842 domain-containing protein [Microvirga lenta]
MGMRTRKLIGTVVMLLFIGFYALFAMAVAEGRVRDASTAVQTIVYVVLGLIWVIPMMPLIRWMNKPDEA